jgi:branched-chain amino acid transport system ATP-binding protein
MSSLVLENVSRSFGGVHAVADVSLRAPRGSITGLIGPNGAGKTTLINLITGTLGLSSGRITLDGADLGMQEPDVVARRGVSRTFQNIRLLPEASVLENVMIGFHRHERVSILSGLLGLPASRRETAQIMDKSMTLLERFRLKRFAGMPAGALSYGHQRRVEMARAAASDPAILLLDEPVAGMNDIEANEMGDVFAELASGNMGLLLIEHNIRFVTRMASHVYVLAAGRMICEGSPQAVMRDEQVVVAYLGRK